TQNFRTICQGDSIQFGEEFIKKQGVYSKTFVSSLGCDSTSTLVLSVVNVIKEFQTHHICLGDSVRIGNSVYYNSGFYFDTLPSSRGCDSIIESTIIVNQVTFSQSFQICQGEVVRVGSSVYTQSGIYRDSLISMLGC